MRPLTHSWHVAVLLLPVLAGCGAAAGAAAGAWTTAVDTLPGGATRVVNTPPEGAIPATWVLEEELRIGSIDEAGPASFGQIRGIAALDDGGVAVLDAQAHEVRIFGPDGEHRATHGGKGAGPGELESPYGLQAGPDGLLRVPDHRNARMTLYHPARGFERAYALRCCGTGSSGTASSPTTGGCYSPRSRWTRSAGPS